MYYEFLKSNNAKVTIFSEITNIFTRKFIIFVYVLYIFNLFCEKSIKIFGNVKKYLYLCITFKTQLDNMIRLTEALQYAEQNGKKIKLNALAQEIWGNTKIKKSAYMNLLNLKKGASKSVGIEQVAIICQKLGVSADYLFGLSDIPNYNSYLKERKEEVLEKANDVIQVIQTI